MRALSLRLSLAALSAAVSLGACGTADDASPLSMQDASIDALDAGGDAPADFTSSRLDEYVQWLDGSRLRAC